jgi:hypothetical protein
MTEQINIQPGRTYRALIQRIYKDGSRTGERRFIEIELAEGGEEPGAVKTYAIKSARHNDGEPFFKVTPKTRQSRLILSVTAKEIIVHRLLYRADGVRMPLNYILDHVQPATGEITHLEFKRGDRFEFDFNGRLVEVTVAVVRGDGRYEAKILDEQRVFKVYRENGMPYLAVAGADHYPITQFLNPDLPDEPEDPAEPLEFVKEDLRLGTSAPDKVMGYLEAMLAVTKRCQPFNYATEEANQDFITTCHSLAKKIVDTMELYR